LPLMLHGNFFRSDSRVCGLLIIDVTKVTIPTRPSLPYVRCRSRGSDRVFGYQLW
jgi:hypothetical protein